MFGLLAICIGLHKCPQHMDGPGPDKGMFNKIIEVISTCYYDKTSDVDIDGLLNLICCHVV